MALILSKLALFLALMLFIMAPSTLEARELALNPGRDLQARLFLGIGEGGEAEGGLVNCWNSLVELRSCTNEILLFFLNGESYLGLDCCRAIRVITHHCWPSMLTSLGFTAEEGDILRGYCDASPSAPLPPAVPSPALAPEGVINEKNI
ncbi:hypothetical protein Syun_013768 [Stephania yunnanensis]|uniref:Prolamin-like domain-containing protein n=1 Tax=Stephania yunnanensis TaxID=152371 RepID=A0AAP0P812_9MAGN